MKLFKKTYCCTISIPYLILIIATLFSACHRPEARENNALASPASLNQAANEKYFVGINGSRVTYKGSMVLASKGSHTGYVYLSKGELLMEKGHLVGGTVVVDMNTIEDKDHGSKNELVRHLKSSDFFDVEKFPFATFAITLAVPVNSETINVTGNLTIKGITHAVTFPAKMEVKGEVVRVSGKMTIDRTQWDVRYNSGRFFSNLADEVIADDIEFEVMIYAKKSDGC